MSHSDTVSIILAAGKGTRMKSALPKVLHPVGGLPMLGHVMRAAEHAGLSETIIVVSPEQESIKSFVTHVSSTATMAIQQQQNGTGDAVIAAMPLPAHIKRAVIMFGDTPLMRPETLRQLAGSKAQLTVLGFTPEDPQGYGRILLSDNQTPVEIIEHKDADEELRQITLCNGGAMAVDREILDQCLEQLNSNNAQGEYYLPDLVKLAVENGYSTGLVLGDVHDIMGVDSRAGLSKAEAVFQNRQRRHFLDTGVTLQSPETVHFSFDTTIETDVVIEPHCVFGPGVSIASGALIKAFSHLEGAQVGNHAVIGPYARLRPGTELADGVKIGNFVETKKAKIGLGAKVNHLSYIGDAEIGAGANIGAGTITCNYDGFNKHKTEIGAGAFIGSNSSLIAPVRIGDGAYVGSSSVLSGEVEADALAVTRAPARTIRGWAAKFRNKNSKGN